MKCVHCGKDQENAVCKECASDLVDKSNRTRGTPKKMVEAVINGITDSESTPGFTPFGRAIVIERHVLDFLNQQFGVAMLNAHDNRAAENALRLLLDNIKKGV